MNAAISMHSPGSKGVAGSRGSYLKRVWTCSLGVGEILTELDGIRQRKGGGCWSRGRETGSARSVMPNFDMSF